MKRQRIYGAYFLAVLFLIATTGLQVIHHFCGSCEQTAVLPAALIHDNHEPGDDHCEAAEAESCCTADRSGHKASCQVSILKVKIPFANNSEQEQQSTPAVIDIKPIYALGLIQEATPGTKISAYIPSPPAIYLNCQLLI